MRKKAGIRLWESLTGWIIWALITIFRPPVKLRNIEEMQLRALWKLLKKAKNTNFGKAYNFKSLLLIDNAKLYATYQSTVPVFHYEKIFETWWKPLLHGEKNHVWPGKVHYMGITSATSSGHNKTVPVSDEIIRNSKKVFSAYIHHFPAMGVPWGAIAKDFFIVGGSSSLEDNGRVKLGFFSGILSYTSPLWYRQFSCPPQSVLRLKTFTEKREKILASAKEWDVGIMSGFPVWMVSLCEDIVKKYGLNTIHDIWPNLCMFQHGGMQMEPYRERWEKLLGKPVITTNGYAATEGVMAFSRVDKGPLELLNADTFFYEFIPVSGTDFDEYGIPLGNPEIRPLWQIESGKEYAIVITNCSGAWRYILGDTIIFRNTENFEFDFAGRTAHYLNMCGEHVSFVQLQNAISEISNLSGGKTFDYTVSCEAVNQSWQYHLYLSELYSGNPEELVLIFDNALIKQNMDYSDFRKAGALLIPKITMVAQKKFMEFLQLPGKDNAQLKFPRLMKGKVHEQWKNLLSQE